MKLENKSYVRVAEAGKLILIPLEHIVSTVEHPSGRGLFQGPKDVQQGGFSYPRRPDYGNALSSADYQIHFAKELDAVLTGPKYL
jgi:hypothetical protein